MRRPSRFVAIVVAALGLLQLTYGAWAAHSDALAGQIIRTSESCQLQRLMTPIAGRQRSVGGPCQIEKAIVVDAYISSSRSGTRYHVITLQPSGTRDNTQLTARGAYPFWRRLRSTELIAAQRFVAPGYRLTGRVLALADTAGTAMDPDHPESGAYPNAIAMFMGSVLFAVGIAMSARARPRAAAPPHAEYSTRTIFGIPFGIRY